MGCLVAEINTSEKNIQDHARPCKKASPGMSRCGNLCPLSKRFQTSYLEKAFPLNVSLWKLKLLQSVWHQIVSDR